jgi:hypothetical protein
MTQKEKAIHRRSRFLRHSRVTRRGLPNSKAAPRRPSGYVTTIGTEPQVAPVRAAITRS